MDESKIRRGDLFYADLSPVVGSEQGGMRPVLVIQNNIGNHYSPTVIIAAITAKISKPKMPPHVGIKGGEQGVGRNSVILMEQIRTIDKQRLHDKIGRLDDQKMKQVDEALKVSIGLVPNT
ncbi:type II toxin-antitoxin system PemK/MazF family toxin [Pediococcus pentosaceus]|uniref:type II toxin-antitoxin system PemK/MazF family toxin n=1 Tax=Pediococcus pentosaceus TaxID=1255 RepID=UPI0018A15A70|nr:type II toxin-antitoxin system PemK/MazF family toxin [Pediococcus pentosaceus]MBF7132204.1 type II toxin-antitoxin system PemK/MazF family toxin [Pediococcus pentosaceus]